MPTYCHGRLFAGVFSAPLERGIVWIKWLGTHVAYDDVDAATVEFRRSE